MKIKKFYQKNSKVIRIIAAGLIVVALYFFGYVVGHENLIFEKNLKPKITNAELYKPRSVDFSAFWDVWNQVSSKFVGTTDPQKMIDGAIKGMVNAIGDPYTVYMDATEAKSFAADLSGQFSGIGAQLAIKDGKIMVVSPIAGTPAEKIGLKPQDQIVKIDGQATESMLIDTAISKIRGPKGTKVTLNILRTGWTGPQDFIITRDTITIKSVDWKMEDGNIAYISINQFGDDTTDLMKQAAKEIAVKNPKAIVLDLRNNPGGYLQSAIDVSSLFVPKGSVVVKEKYKDNHIDTQSTTLDPVLQNYKVFILVNGGSASAAEITAGALQDLNGSLLIGEKTFGKGSVQELENLGGGASLKVTIAHWLTPKDRAIDKVGLAPDIAVDLTEADANADRDPQLDRALLEARK